MICAIWLSVLVWMNFCNHPDWYQRGHLFFGEGKNGKSVKKAVDHSFHNARFLLVGPICGQKPIH
jgi:hypothetical protein